MKEINEIISDNIKLFRKQHGYSLDHLSELTGVSKTMLGQIERKTSTPSITTLWKIASGLKVSFTELTQESDAIINKITLDQTQALSSEHNKYQIFSIFKFDIERKIESFMAVIEPSGKISVSPHGAGSMKYITVYDGTVTITLDGEKFILQQHESIKFNGNMFQQYNNEHNETARLHIVIHY